MMAESRVERERVLVVCNTGNYSSKYAVTLRNHLEAHYPGEFEVDAMAMQQGEHQGVLSYPHAGALAYDERLLRSAHHVIMSYHLPEISLRLKQMDLKARIYDKSGIRERNWPPEIAKAILESRKSL